mgnify:CR=1 FL=1
MGGFGFGLVAEEDAALHLLWNGGAGEAEPCFGHVDEADEAVDFLAGCWGGPERLQSEEIYSAYYQPPGYCRIE